MPEELDEIMRRCEAAGLDFSDDGDQVTVYFPGTVGIFINDGAHARWALKEPFEEYRVLEGFEASWSPSQQVIECNLVHLNPEARKNVGIGRGEYLESLYEDLADFQRRVAGKEPRSKQKHRGELIQRILLRLTQGKPNYSQVPFDPRHRIVFDSSTELSISIGLSSNVHSLLQEATMIGDFKQSAVDYSLTLRIEGGEVNDYDSAVGLLIRVADSALLAVDSSFELPLALERDYSVERVVPPRKGTFPLPAIDFEYDRAAMNLYWNARATTAMPTIQFLAYYQVLEYFFSQLGRHHAERNGPGEGRMLEAIIRNCTTLYDLRSFIVESVEREIFFYGSDHARKLSRYYFSKPRSGRHDPRETASRRIYQIRNRIVHAKSGYEHPLLPSDPETKNLKHDIDLVEFLARKALERAKEPLRIRE